MEDPMELAVRVSPGPRAPGIARHAVTALGPTDTEAAANAALLVSELVANTVRHGGLRPEDRVEVVIRRDPRTLRIEVRDWGRGFGGSSEVSGEVTSGFGLVLVAGIADRWGIEGGPPTNVWFELDLDEDHVEFRGEPAGVSVASNGRT
jgi:anti-sigma regulatory factor (Ser/Thr protein kinase)